MQIRWPHCAHSTGVALAVAALAIGVARSAPAQDCDGNGAGDAVDICSGALDMDGDHYLDSCEYAYGNFDLDGDIDGADLSVVLNMWGHIGPVVGDIDGNEVVNAADLAVLLVRWGPVPYGGSGTPGWATVIEFDPDPAVVINENLRCAISATGLPWRVLDTATQIEMLLVPPGTFMMGCSASASYTCYPSERPTHEVTLTNAFYLGRHEVTQAQWQAVMGSNPSYFAGYPDSPSRPVERVSWNAIQDFNIATGLRLPTEAEWEYAYRAGTSTAFHSGPGFATGTNDDALIGNIAWMAANAGAETHTVGGKARNALGIHDMAGNLWEWCQDWWGDYPTANQTNPAGPLSGPGRVARGGSWYDQSGHCRASSRGFNSPSVPHHMTGFRAARSP